MNLSYSGAAYNMHNTKIFENGPHPAQLSVGDTQHMNFEVHDPGPFWMDPMTKLATKYDRVLNTIEKIEKTKVQLLIELRSKGFDTSSKRFLKDDLLELCKANNISTSTEEKT